MIEREVENYLETILSQKGWNGDVSNPDRNIYRQNPRSREEINKLKDEKGNSKHPDFILYESSKTKYPIAIIEVKRTSHKDLNAALDQGLYYAEKLKSPYLFVFNKNRCKAIHVPSKKFLKKDDQEVSEILSLEELKTFDGHISKKEKAVINTKQDLINIFDKVNDKLREAGITVGIQRFTEFSNLLFLKLISELNDEINYNLSKTYLWSNYKGMKGETLLAYINDTVIPQMNLKFKTDGEEDGLFTPLKIKDTSVLEDIVEIIDSLDLANVDLDIKGDAFEYFIQKYNQRNNDLGEYFTPRHIVEFLVSVLSPKMFEKIYDPFCGTGGMLITTFKYLYRELERTESLNKDTLDYLRKSTLYGSEISETAKIAKMNMILTGDGHSNIKQQDTFTNAVDGLYNLVITNIPFNLDINSQQRAPYDLDINNGNAAAIQHVIKSLRKDTNNSRGAIIIPEGVLTGSIYKDLREKLVKEKYLIGIISLPSNVFLPYTETKTSILIVSGEAAPKSDSIFFYKVQNDGYTLTTRRRQLPGINDLDEFISLSEELNKNGHLENINHENLINIERDTILENENISLQSVHYHDDDKPGFIRLDEILERVNEKNTLQYPTATINNTSFWGVDLGFEYWGDNFISVTSDSNVSYSVLSDKHISYNPSRVNVGSIGINMSGKKLSVSSAYPVYRVKDTNFLPEYIYLQLTHNSEVKEDIITRCFGTVRQSLGVDDFKKIQIPIKTIKEQKEIINKITTRYNTIKEEQLELSKVIEEELNYEI